MTSRVRGVEIDVEEGDVVTFEADVLVLKHAQAFFGADLAVARKLLSAGFELTDLAPPPGESALVEAPGVTGADGVLFVGVEELYDFRYREIRAFSRRALQALGSRRPRSSHVALTIHGPGYGLDEVEAFEAEIAGVIDAVTKGEHPRQLRRITIVDRDARRVARLRDVLPRLLPRGFIAEADLSGYLADLDASASEQFRSVGLESEGKPSIFVAMPFDDDWLDVWDLAIEPAAHAAGFLCGRADSRAFTGDILEWMKARIRSSALLLAEVSTANPNVFLEVGYAWGCGVPTVLAVRESAEIPFDIRGQRCVRYPRMAELKKRLILELEELRGQLERGSARR